MIIVLIVFLIASIINWRIARKRQAHCWRDESSRRKNQKKTIFVVIRSNVDTTQEANAFRHRSPLFCCIISLM